MRRFVPILAVAAVLLPACAQAQQVYGQPYAPARAYTPAFPPGLEFDIAGGYLNAQSKELVFDPTSKRKMSELRWRDPSAYGVDASFAYRMTPWLTFRAGGFVPVGSKDSQMKDFDWIPPNNVYGFSDLSRHPKTKLTSGYKVDLSLQGDFVQTDTYALGVVGGFDKQMWRWKAEGGDYTYSVNGFRDTIGSFPDTKVITYRQGYDTPYAGVVGTMQFGDLKITARGIGSPYAMVRGNDVHVLRGLNIKSSFDPAIMAGGDIKAEYAVGRNVAIVGKASYERFFETRGRADYKDVSGTLNYPNGGAGVERESLLVTLGLSARM